MAPARTAIVCAVALFFALEPATSSRVPAPAPGPGHHHHYHGPALAPSVAMAPSAARSTPAHHKSPPPPPPLSGQKVTATWLMSRELTSYEVIVLKTAVAQVLAPYGVVTGNVQIGAPRAHSDKHSGRRLLQNGYDYSATIDVPGNTTASAMAGYISSSGGQTAVQNAITSNGGDYAVSFESVSEDSETSTSGCRSKFGHWCLDNSHITRGGCIAIVICLTVFVAACLALTAYFGVRAMRQRSSKGRYALQSSVR